MQARTVTVEREDVELARVVREASEELSWNKARDLCRSGRVRVNDRVVVDPTARLGRGDRVDFDPTGKRLRRGALDADAIVHADTDVVVVNKPAGVLSVPFAPGDKDTLIDQTRAALRRGARGFDPELGIVHRIDIDTTGLLVFSRNLAAKRALSAQFRAHSVHRRYLALAHGQVIGRTFDSTIMRDRGDGLRGSWGVFRAPRGKPPADAQHAVTHVRLLERLGSADAPACLVECMLETGRQHQIRIHLSEAGHPLLGERVYVRDFRGPRIAAPRPLLHAGELGFVHPRTGRDLTFKLDPPADFAKALAELRAGSAREARS
ncbi:MAG: RluA family pseudouridine synthase [Polyangiales bacterium]